jgi:hypothetical protein
MTYFFKTKSSRATVHSDYFMGAIEFWLRNNFNQILSEHIGICTHSVAVSLIYLPLVQVIMSGALRLACVGHKTMLDIKLCWN